jgi:hypothetical protein
LIEQAKACSFRARASIRILGLFENSLVGKQIDSVHVDSEVTYIMLSDGTHVSIRGLVVVEPGRASRIPKKADTAVGS